MYEDGAGTTLQDVEHVVLGNLGLTFHDNLVTLDRYNLTGILIYEVLIPALQHTGSELTTKYFLQRLLINLYLLGKVEDLQNILIGLETNSTEQSGYR